MSKRKYGFNIISLILCLVLFVCLAAGCSTDSGGGAGSGGSTSDAGTGSGAGSGSSTSDDGTGGGAASGSNDTAGGADTTDSGAASGSASGSGSASSGAASDSGSEGAGSSRETYTEFLTPETGEICETVDTASVDMSNISEGYIMVEYTGESDLALLQVTIPDESETYTYPILQGGYQTFPLSCGDGTYGLRVLEQIAGGKYAVVYSTSVDVALSDEFRPYLYPNEYVNYSAECEAVKLGMELSDSSTDDVSLLENIYNYVIENITYDKEKAAGDLSYYVPDIDDTLESGTGICFDYASLMAAMLRSQRIPTKLVFGYSGTAYHAWVSVYLTEYGWVDGIIEFDGESWQLMDPTLGANNGADAVARYVGDGTNYTEKYWY